MNKSKLFCVLICVFVLVCGVVFYLNKNTIRTSETMSASFSRSASTFSSSSNQLYFKDNILYFDEEIIGVDVIKQVKNNRISVFAKLPKSYKGFSVLERDFVIVQKTDAYYLLNGSDGEITELRQGNYVGYYDNIVLFVDEKILYATDVEGHELQTIIKFDELLASYSDAVVYRNGSCIYQLYFDNLNTPQLLIDGDIPWQNEQTSWLLDFKYLYTTEYALRIGSHTIDMFIYKTCEMKRIYETGFENVVFMAIAARNNEMYVSRQLVEGISLLTLDNKEINGTYKYDIRKDLWTKISDETCSALSQYDEEYLYGYDPYGLLYGIRQFKVN